MKIFTIVTLFFCLPVFASRPMGPPGCTKEEQKTISTKKLEELYKRIGDYVKFTDKVFKEEREAHREKLKGTTAWIGYLSHQHALDLIGGYRGKKEAKACEKQIISIQSSFESESGADLKKLKVKNNADFIKDWKKLKDNVSQMILELRKFLN